MAPTVPHMDSDQKGLAGCGQQRQSQNSSLDSVYPPLQANTLALGATQRWQPEESEARAEPVRPTACHNQEGRGKDTETQEGTGSGHRACTASLGPHPPGTSLSLRHFLCKWALQQRLPLRSRDAGHAGQAGGRRADPRETSTPQKRGVTKASRELRATAARAEQHRPGRGRPQQLLTPAARAKRSTCSGGGRKPRTGSW